MKKPVFLFLFTCLFLSSQMAFSTEPLNLVVFKRGLVRYHDSGEYDADIQRVIDQGMNYLTLRTENPKPADTKKPAIVLDIDETALSGYPFLMNHNFCVSKHELLADENTAQFPAINPTLKLYNYARSHGISVFFISYRLESQRSFTAENLRKAGFTHWTKLILRPSSYRNATAVVFKTAMRKQIAHDGYNILLNVGDQLSDLAGGFAEKSLKLPNPYYFVA